MKTFDAAFEALIGHEGGYSNHPDDPGGETMYGITKRVARAHGYTGEMRNLPLATAKSIAKVAYWDVVRGDDMPDELDFQLFDTAYNSGDERAIVLLQRALGVKDDGVLGPATMAAVQREVQRGEVDSLSARFNGQRLLFLANLKSWPSFGKGWARRIGNNLLRIK